jgi:hypothetical protein
LQPAFVGGLTVTFVVWLPFMMVTGEQSALLGTVLPMTSLLT